jgi:tetrapyrrole methylase family protein/MazG family protein
MAVIHVLGLGPGTKSDLPLGVYQRIKQASPLYVRTREHPVVAQLEAEGVQIVSFDRVYEKEKDFQHVYEKIVSYLLTEVQKEHEIYYAVPGHPLVAEQTVRMLFDEEEKGRVKVRIEGGQSFLDPLFSRLKIDPNEGCMILDGTALTVDQLHPKMHQIITQVYDRFVASDVKLTLMELYPDDYEITLVTAVGIVGEEVVRPVPLYELDREIRVSNLSCVYVPPAGEDRVLNRWYYQSRVIFRTLRGPEGCPWDRKQTHRSLRKYVLEEAQEVCEAIDEGDPEHLKEELGDLLLQVFLHAQIAEEEGYFNMEDVLQVLNEKMIRRHPHVFGHLKGTVKDAEDVRGVWQAIKAEEKREKD